MTAYNHGSGFRDAVKSDGTALARDPVTGLLTFGGTGTWYVELGTSSNSVTPAQTALTSAHCTWSAALAATITVETSNAPTYRHGFDNGPSFVTSYEAATTAGNWIPENPSTAIVSVVGTGNSSTAATVTAGGTNAGGCMFHLGNMGARRIRLKIVVTVTGTLSANVVGKIGD